MEIMSGLFVIGITIEGRTTQENLHARPHNTSRGQSDRVSPSSPALFTCD